MNLSNILAGKQLTLSGSTDSKIRTTDKERRLAAEIAQAILTLEVGGAESFAYQLDIEITKPIAEDAFQFDETTLGELLNTCASSLGANISAPGLCRSMLKLYMTKQIEQNGVETTVNGKKVFIHEGGDFPKVRDPSAIQHIFRSALRDVLGVKIEEVNRIFPVWGSKKENEAA